MPSEVDKSWDIYSSDDETLEDAVMWVIDDVTHIPATTTLDMYEVKRLRDKCNDILGGGSGT